VLSGRVIRVDPALAQTTYGDLDRKEMRPARTAGESPADDVLAQHNERCAWL
jgi:hypothetical protein